MIDIPDQVRSTLKVTPISERMHPDDQGRRRARVETITKTYRIKKDAVYVDAATHLNGNGTALTMHDVLIKDNVSVLLKNCAVTDTNGAAVAEGNRCMCSLLIITNSQDACRRYMNGRASRQAADIQYSSGASN
ncbi:hypothetical protein MTO96_031843 [Rhipicephalus appendiculatus]